MHFMVAVYNECDAVNNPAIFIIVAKVTSLVGNEQEAACFRYHAYS